MNVPPPAPAVPAPDRTTAAAAPAGSGAPPHGHRGLRRTLRRMLEWRAQPMTDADLRRSAVVFAPHPDDETLGCGGTILRKRSAGAEVTIVFLTDGRTSHGERMAVTELIGRRRSEAIAAARALDVAERRVIFLNFEDGVLADQRAEAVRRVTSLLCDERPEQIFVTSRWDTTPDHVAAAEIVKAAAAEACRDAARFEYLVWYWAHWPWAARRHLEHERIGAMLRHSARRFAALMRADLVRVPVGDLLAAKWAALGEHATQMQKFQGDDGWPTLGEVWDGGFLDCAFGESELFIRS